MNCNTAKFVIRAASAMLLAALPWCAACDRAAPRYRVQGTVTFEGQPVSAGTILFRPDATRGQTGDAGFALITQGRYDTGADGGKGTLGGSIVAVISGYDGRAADEQPLGTPLFSPYEVPMDLPAADATHDFTLPPPR